MPKFITQTEQLAPYKNLFNFDPNKPYEVTMFRFPFRKHASQISSTIYNEVMITRLRRDLAEKGKELSFLSNVKKVTFSLIQNGHVSMNESGLWNRKLMEMVIPRQYEQWDTYGFRCSSSRSSYSQGRQTTSSKATFNVDQYQSRPDHCEAERWLKQAHTDCNTMKHLLAVMRKDDRLIGDPCSVVCQVIFLAHETIEKSLKAGMYRLVGLNPGYLTNHQIIVHARSICSQKQDGHCLNRVQHDGKISLVSIAKWMTPLYINSRFPNAHPSSMAPVDMYSQDDAEKAAEYALRTISFIESKCTCD